MKYDKWAERLTIIIEIMFLISILVIYFKLQDLYNKYHELNFKLYEIKEEIK